MTPGMSATRRGLRLQSSGSGLWSDVAEIETGAMATFLGIHCNRQMNRERDGDVKELLFGPYELPCPEKIRKSGPLSVFSSGFEGLALLTF